MKLREHCCQCYDELGNAWGEVHEWLDMFAEITYPLAAHRSKRHHADGVEEVREKWGDEAAEAAELHILEDVKCMGYVPFIPRDEEQASEISGDFGDFVEGD